MICKDFRSKRRFVRFSCPDTLFCTGFEILSKRGHDVGALPKFILRIIQKNYFPSAMISREAKFNQYSKSNSSWIIQPSRRRKLIFLATEKPCPWSFIFIPIITTPRLQVNEHKFQLIKYFLNLDLMFESPENVLIKNIFRDILQCHKNTDIYYNKCNCRRIIWISFFDGLVVGIL